MTMRRTFAIAALLTAGAAFVVYGQDRSSMPDPTLTPGAVASTDVSDVCGKVDGLTYSQRHRQTSYELKTWIFREYGIDPPHGIERSRWEIDHRVPLCLGGADEAANLWPQHDFADKDKIEAETCRAVCSGQMSLAAGQARFLGDWRH